ncbi:MAG: hypothetical protein KDA85_02665, partial [Planctomycetaceae bacterium]|nr:hypothetical protein [Planctomycetaceae bacterium]
ASRDVLAPSRRPAAFAMVNGLEHYLRRRERDTLRQTPEVFSAFSRSLPGAAEGDGWFERPPGMSRRRQRFTSYPHANATRLRALPVRGIH